MGKTDLKVILNLVLAGALVMVGMRAVEYLWPRPDMRVVFCLIDVGGTVDDCRPLSDWLEEQGAPDA